MAGAKFTGDFDKLAKLVKGIESLTAAHGFIRDCKRHLAEEALSQVQRSFSTGTDPSGRPWKPLRSRPGGQPLRDTGRLYNSLRTQQSPAGFSVETNVIYARVHNLGAVIRPKNAEYLRFRVGGARGGGRGKGASWVSVKKVVIPRRQFLPSGKLPAPWKRNFVSVLRELRKQRLGR